MTLLAPNPLMLAPRHASCVRLAEALGAAHASLPEIGDLDALERWRVEARERPIVDAIVICLGLEAVEPDPLSAIDVDAWDHRFEHPWLLYNVALGHAERRIADGGSIVAIVQAAAVPDTEGFAPERALAEGATALVRSVAERHAHRGVRANVVTSPIGLTADARPEREVVGAVQLLLSPHAVGLAGRVAPVDGGRTL